MSIFDRQVETAQRLIEKNGQLVYWRKASSEVDSNAPWKPTATDLPIDTPVKIVFLPTGRIGEELVRFIKGSEVTTGSVSGLMPAVDFEPSAKDTVIRNGKELRISSVDPLSPNGEIILYTIEFAQ